VQWSLDDAQAVWSPPQQCPSEIVHHLYLPSKSGRAGDGQFEQQPCQHDLHHIKIQAADARLRADTASLQMDVLQLLGCLVQWLDAGCNPVSVLQAAPKRIGCSAHTIQTLA